MPRSAEGAQLITFTIEDGGDIRFSGYTYLHVTKNMNTCRKIAANRGDPSLARTVADLNGVRSVDSKLKKGRRMRVPDRLRINTTGSRGARDRRAFFHAWAGDSAPRIVGGYAQIDTVDRSERAGLSIFRGYDPIVCELPLRFEADANRHGGFLDADGSDIERDIAVLEEMAGRGNFVGAAVGPPCIVKVTTTDTRGRMVQLLPAAYQRDSNNPTGPIWWISGIDWDDEGVRNDRGERIRQLCTVTLTQYVSAFPIGGAADRGKAKNNKSSKKGGKK